MGISVWKRSLGNFGSGICLWELSLWTFRSGTFTWTLPLGNVWLGVFSPIRLAYKGFLLYSKAIGGLLRVVPGPGSPKELAVPRRNRPPGFPEPPELGSPPQSQKSKIAFGTLNCQENSFGVLSCRKMPSPKVQNSRSQNVQKSKSRNIEKSNSRQVPKSQSRKS